LDRSCYCLWDLQSTDRSPALQEMLALVAQVGEHSRELLLRALEARELAGATVVAPGVSMPHCRSILVDDFVIVVGRSRKGVSWPDDPVKLIVLFISPVKPSGPQEHMDLIKHMAGKLGESGTNKLFSASSAGQLAKLLGFQLAESRADAPGS
jgi:mannitol/fructose-specific phosphotransferase system IIA component (Ntr-type)